MNVTQSGSGYTPVTSAITSTDIGTFPDPNEDKNVVFNATGKDTAPRSGINYFSTSTLPVDATLAEVSSIIEPYNSTLHYSTWISDTPDNQASWTKVGNFTRTENIKKEWFDSKQYVCFCPYLTEPAASSGVPVVQMRDIGLVVSGIKLTLTDDKDLANFRVGDAIIQNDANLSDPSYSQFAVIDSGGAANVAPPDRPSRLFDGDLTSFPGGYTNNVYYYTFPEISQLAFTTLEIHGKRDTANQTSDVLVNGISIKDQLPTTNGWVTITGITSPLQTLTIVLTKEPETPLGGGTVNQLNAIRLDGTILIDGPDIWPKGDIASIDASNNTLTLSNAEGTWDDSGTYYAIGPVIPPATGVVSGQPANSTINLGTTDGRWIIGQPVLGPADTPATYVESYLTWDNSNVVTGMTSVDPGFDDTNNLNITFPATAPSGDSWDVELPPGTYMQTRVQASNDSGTVDTGWSNAYTPRASRAADYNADEAFAEKALRLLTFENRKHVYCGQQAEAKRDAAIQSLADQGYTLPDILKYL